MPIYEYVCRGCGHEFELIVNGSAAPACAACGGAELDKRLSVFAVGGAGTAADREPPGACRTCGDPRGPGSCELD